MNREKNKTKENESRNGKEKKKRRKEGKEKKENGVKKIMVRESERKRMKERI